MKPKQSDAPFPLKRYYLLYGGIGFALFYLLLFFLFIRAERKALYDEYVYSVSEKARNLYVDIERDYLTPRRISIEQMASIGPEERSAFRRNIKEIITMDFSLSKLKLFTAGAITLYDHNAPENEGHLYAKRSEVGFESALQGKTESEIVVESGGRRLMEAYLPIKQKGTDKVIAVLEVYEDVTRFENQVNKAMSDALVLPTIVFLVFNIILFLIVAKADGIIADKTNLLLAIRRNMEKYLSPSAVTAICQAVSDERELFQGERQGLVVLFSDIRDFTAYAESIEPEEVVQTLNAVFQVQAKIIQDNGGVIDKFVGDEVMATFAGGQEAEAVRTAIQLLEAINKNLNIDMKIGIGIHSGEAVVGSIGTEDRRDFTAIGDTINIGARICSASPPGVLYVSDHVFQRLPLDMQTSFSGHKTLHLKGKAEPVGVHVFTSSASASEQRT